MLLRARDIVVTFSDHVVLRGADFTVSKGDCVALIGNNGSGKSTLLRVLNGDLRPDHGTVENSGEAGLLTQSPNLPGHTVQDTLDLAMAWHAELLSAYEEAITGDQLNEAGDLQDRLDEAGWDLSHRVAAICERLHTPAPETELSTLSGGQQRRVALAVALLGQPELLLLDEPTNHLDSEAIEWLQSFLIGYRGAVVLVTHDRYLLEAVADHIVEIEDGKTTRYAGSYSDYLIAKAERRSQQEQTESRRVSTLAREAAWASRSPAARSTKQKARLKRLDVLRDERPLITQRGFDLDLSSGFKGGQSLIELDNLTGGYGEDALFTHLNDSIQAKSVVGIVGPNGVGKSTLFKLICRTLEPMGGQVHRAPRVKLAMIDQARTGLDPTDTLFDAAGGGNSHVTIGEHSIHVASFLKRFLFRREQLTQRVASLSGGERMRLLLARLLLGGANVLLLDEPTNDLDLMTLRVLEEALIGFDGASMIISHDRALLDRVCTAVLSFEPGGKVVRYASRIQAVQAAQAAQAAQADPDKKKAKPETPKAKKEPKIELSWADRKELAALPGRIERMEADKEALGLQLADPQTYQGPPKQAAELGQAFSTLEDNIAAAYARWEQIEAR
jgi:ATP-binding cassette subfamily F protein uup